MPVSFIDLYTNSGGHDGTVVIHALHKFNYRDAAVKLKKIYSLFNESDESDPDASSLEDNELFEVLRNLWCPNVDNVAQEPRLIKVTIVSPS